VAFSRKEAAVVAFNGKEVALTVVNPKNTGVNGHYPEKYQC